MNVAVSDIDAFTGERLMSTSARVPHDNRQPLAEALMARQAGQGERLANNLAEGFDTGSDKRRHLDDLGTLGDFGTNGAKVEAKIRLMFSSSATTNSALVHDPAKGVLVAGGNDSGGNVGTMQVASGFAVGGGDVWTNTSRQVRYVAGAGGSIWVWNDGFYFPCGRIS